jgi:multiple sugar transport system substrate-binding protein
VTTFRSTPPLVLIVLALLLAACGNDDQPGAGDDATPPPPDAVEGDMFAFGFGYETGDIIAQTRIDEFREQYPNVNVTFSESGFEEGPFLSALAGGDPPDLVNIPRNQIGSYIARGVLMPLDDCIAQEDIDTGVFYESALDQVTVDGTIYALPEFFNTRIWIINNVAFEEAGLDPETFDFSDWDAIAEANETMTRVDNGRLSRIGIDVKAPEHLPIWAWANGAPMISEDGRQAQLDDPAVAEALEFMVAQHEVAGGRTAFLDFRDTWDFFGSENQIVADQIGAWPMEQWYLNVLAEASPEADFSVRGLQTREGDPITWSDGNSWAIPEATGNFDAACAFIRTMTATETWVAAAEARRDQRAEDGLPNMGVYTANHEADDIIFSEIVDLSEWPALEQAVQTVIEHQEHAFALPPSPAAAQFQDAWTSAANGALGGDDPAQALEQAQQEAQSAIDAAAPQ